MLRIIILIIIIYIFYIINKLLNYEYFSGDKFSDELLNNTLIKIINILNNENIDNWFIGYGTLLGLIRNESCINADDDIDIMIDIKNKENIYNIIKKYNFKYIINKTNFIKLSINEKLPTIDFYLCNVDEETSNFNDTWENLIWSNCKPIIKKKWKNIQINLPNNAELKLENKYGYNWRTPINGYKGEDKKII